MKALSRLTLTYTGRNLGSSSVQQYVHNRHNKLAPTIRAIRLRRWNGGILGEVVKKEPMCIITINDTMILNKNAANKQKSTLIHAKDVNILVPC